MTNQSKKKKPSQNEVKRLKIILNKWLTDLENKVKGGIFENDRNTNFNSFK